MNQKTKDEIEKIKVRLSVISRVESVAISEIKSDEGQTVRVTEKEEKVNHIKDAISLLEIFLK
jgi:hypothetical protein